MPLKQFLTERDIGLKTTAVLFNYLKLNDFTINSKLNQEKITLLDERLKSKLFEQYHNIYL